MSSSSADLGRLPAQDLAEDENGALARRELLERSDEREPHGLAPDGDLRRVALGDDAAVGDRLDPRDLRQRAQVGDLGLPRRPQVHGARAAVAAAEHVQADVRRDAVEPGAKLGPTLEAVVASPGADERLLYRVLGLERRAEHPVAVGGELDPVLLEAVLQFGSGRLGRRGRLRHGCPCYVLGRGRRARLGRRPAGE